MKNVGALYSLTSMFLHTTGMSPETTTSWNVPVSPSVGSVNDPLTRPNSSVCSVCDAMVSSAVFCNSTVSDFFLAVSRKRIPET